MIYDPLLAPPNATHIVYQYEAYFQVANEALNWNLCRFFIFRIFWHKKHKFRSLSGTTTKMVPNEQHNSACVFSVFYFPLIGLEA